MERRRKLNIRTEPKIRIRNFPNTIDIICETYKKDALPHEEEVSKDMQCNICFENIYMMKTQYRYISPCNHSFCMPCITNWRITKIVQANKKIPCPICRRNIKEDVGFITFKLSIPIRLPDLRTNRRLSIRQLKDVENQIATKLYPYRNLKLSSFELVFSMVKIVTVNPDQLQDLCGKFIYKVIIASSPMLQEHGIKNNSNRHNL